MTTSNDFQIYFYDGYVFVHLSGLWDSYERKGNKRPFSTFYRCAVHLLSIHYVKYRPDCDVAVAGEYSLYCYRYFLLLLLFLLFESKKCVLTCSRRLDNKYVGMHRTYERMRVLNPRAVRGLTETKRR